MVERFTCNEDVVGSNPAWGTNLRSWYSGCATGFHPVETSSILVGRSNLNTMYKTIPEFPEYSISELGEVYSNHVNRCLSPYVNNKGYPCVKLSLEGREYTLLISRLLCRVYKDLPDLTSDLEVDHVDRDPANFALENLQVLTKKEHLEKTLRDKGQFSIHFCACGAERYREAQQCKKCYLSSVTHDISKEDIEFWVRKYSWVRASKELGLSDNGLRKKYKALGGDHKNIKKVRAEVA